MFFFNWTFIAYSIGDHDPAPMLKMECKDMVEPDPDTLLKRIRRAPSYMFSLWTLYSCIQRAKY